MTTLCLVLGDQLSQSLQAIQSLDKQVDRILMAETYHEAHYVKHNKRKIALIFSAMRHFANELRDQGYQVDYYEYQQYKDQFSDFTQIVGHHLGRYPFSKLVCTEPGEYRVKNMMLAWQKEWDIAVTIEPDTRFFFSLIDTEKWFDRGKQPRMEHFYQWARKRTGLLMHGNQPQGGRYNFDKQNRQTWQDDTIIPDPFACQSDDITDGVLLLVNQEFTDHPGELVPFNYAVTRQQALLVLQDFIDQRLYLFGDFQDALADRDNRLFHSLLSAYLNIGLLLPGEVCEAAIAAYQEGLAPLNAVEGFVRQILGWREYVRGLYWHYGEPYKANNALNATRSLPSWFWNGKTNMRCLEKAITASLDEAYAHHIQRLMIIGNFSLLSGLSVSHVCDWYLAVYIDAFEWVELPNTLGMALYADNGIIASKPYAASASYINKMGNHCQSCQYDPKQSTGAKACPYNALYWNFINLHQEKFAKHPRMALMVKHWRNKEPETQDALTQWAQRCLANINQL
jgi:deoxyribodipyrimidine photolyase-related protein